MTVLRIGLMIAGAALICSCSRGLKVETDFDPDFDFTGLKSYGWAERILTDDDDPRIYNETFEKKIRWAIDMVMKERGLIESWSKPDLLVGWHGSVDTKITLQTINDDYNYHNDWTVPIGEPAGSAAGGGASAYAREWDQGTLIIDIVSAAEHALVWRGTGTVAIENEKEVEADQEEFNKLVAKILAKFPPK